MHMEAAVVVDEQLRPQPVPGQDASAPLRWFGALPCAGLREAHSAFRLGANRRDLRHVC